jgi:hypothetical protein
MSFARFVIWQLLLFLTCELGVALQVAYVYTPATV